LVILTHITDRTTTRFIMTIGTDITHTIIIDTTHIGGITHIIIIVTTDTTIIIVTIQDQVEDVMLHQVHWVGINNIILHIIRRIEMGMRVYQHLQRKMFQLER